MIPLRLRLHNFMSHADTDLDLRGIRAAVLTGHNGAGKSTILDAITYALWDRARSGGDQLVRLGEVEMWVEMIFAVEGKTYRVWRRRSTKKHVSSQVELHYLPNPENVAAGVELSGTGVRETQAKILEVVRMDYETFVASAFLAQGQSDVFTAATPRERKALLGEMLGLRQYDALASAARDRHRSLQAHAEALEVTRGELQARVEAGASIAVRLLEAKADLTKIGEAIRLTTEEQVRHAQAGEAIQGAAALVIEARRVESAVRETLAALDQEAQLTRTKAESVAWRLADRSAVEKAFAEWERLHAADAEARARHEAWQDLDQQIAKAEAEARAAQQDIELAIAKLRAQAESARGERRARMEVARKEIAAKPEVERELANVRARLEQLAGLDAEMESIQARGETLNADLARMGAEHAAHLETISSLRRRQALMDAELGGEHDRATCPLCASALDEAAIARVRADAEAEVERVNAAAAGLEIKMAETKKAIAASRDAYRAKLTERAERGDLQAREMKLADRLTRMAEAEAAIDALEQEAEVSNEPAIAELQQKAEDLARAHRDLIGGWRARQDALGHDPAEYKRLREQLVLVSDAPRRLQEIQQDALVADRLADQLKRIAEDRARHESELARAREAIAAGEEQEQRLAAWRKQATIIEADLADLRDQEATHRTTIGRLEAEAAAHAADVDRLKAKTAEWSQALEAAQNFKALATAFGANGIQAMAIEHALPEIEEEANRLLARISDNRMHVQIVTQREKKAGGLAETLDIRIADDAGERDYAMFSGGEAFRVNFALRLALSRLLARRAGARLQTLVIDEGFGTQDDVGRTRLVEALGAISGEFERILVVTHIRELKEAFNTQIEVTKRDGVSSVRLVA